MNPLVGLGTCAGLGVTLIVSGLMRRASADPARPTWAARTGYGLTKLLRLSGSSRHLGQDLNVLGRSEESLAVATTLATVTAASGGVVVCAALGRLSVQVPISIWPLVCLATGLAGAVVPSLLVERSARSARRDLVHSLACWLELVALAQAGGMGIESALDAASSLAGDPSFLRIRRALDRARHAGRSPWDGLGRLGSELGVNELEELAASVRLAGTEGARIRPRPREFHNRAPLPPRDRAHDRVRRVPRISRSRDALAPVLSDAPRVPHISVGSRPRPAARSHRANTNPPATRADPRSTQPVSEIQLILFLVETLRYRMADARLEPDRGDVAEKVVIVAIFVALAIAVGAVITKAVTGDATNISHQITASQ